MSSPQTSLDPALPTPDRTAPYNLMWEAIEAAQRVSAGEKPNPDAEEMRRRATGTSSLFALTVHLVMDQWGPRGHVLMYREGDFTGKTTITLEPVTDRNVERAYAWVATLAGVLVDHGPMQCQEGTWRFHLQRPNDPRLQRAMCFTMAVGPDPRPPLPVFVNGRAPRHENQWARLYKVDPPRVSEYFGYAQGILPVPVALPGFASAEVLLCLRVNDRLAKELKRDGLRRLQVTGGHRVTRFGPMGYLLFWLPTSKSNAAPWTGFSMPIDPLVSREIELWRILAAQSHWHVFLMGANDRLHAEIELLNTQELDVVLDKVEAARGAAPMIDPVRARAAFQEQYSVSRLLAEVSAN